jgi:hypothetical protein
VEMINTSSASPISTPPPSYTGVAPGLPSTPPTATSITAASTLPVATSTAPTDGIRPSLLTRFGMDASQRIAEPWDRGRSNMVNRRVALSPRTSQQDTATSNPPWSHFTANRDMFDM